MRLILLLLLFIVAQCIYSQNNSLTPFVDKYTSPQWYLRSNNSITHHSPASQWYLNTDMGFGYKTSSFIFGTNFHMNQQQKFVFQPDRLIIIIDDPNINFSDSTQFRARPDKYELNQPLDVFWGFKKNNWGLFSSLSLLTQRTSSEKPEPGIASDSLFFINWIPLEKESKTLIGSFIGSYRWNSFNFSAGLTSMPLIDVGDDNFKYQYKSKLYPYWGISWIKPNTVISAFTDSKQYGINLNQKIYKRIFSNHPIQANCQFRSNSDYFQSSQLKFQIAIPVTDKLLGSLGYFHVWHEPGLNSRNNFREWQESTIISSINPLNQSIPGYSFSFGFEWAIHKKTPIWPIQMVNFRLYQDHIFSAKREFYANNPVATIELFNKGQDPVDMQLTAETSNDMGRFKSEPIKINPHEIKSVPLYLYLSDKNQSDNGSSEQLMISASIEEQHRVLSTMPLRIYGKHAWDGNTWGLKHFISPNDPTIKANAKRIYLNGIRKYSGLNGYQKQFLLLKSFINEFGQQLNYVPDPTTTMDVDQVQYPVETFEKKGGDCEDLTVCLASGLMAIGKNAAIVDIRPKLSKQITVPTAQTNSIGHVFLLVDTGIQSEYMDKLQLNEFQAISRKNPSGHYTIWLPIETSVLNKGFEAAFQEGVKQYYQEVIQKNGVLRGNIHVYDLN